MTGIGIGDALFTKAQQRVLSLLFGQVDRSYYLNEIVRHAAMGKGAISRELTKLTDAGLLVVTKQGNQRHYQVNKNTPIFDELKQLVVKTFGITDVLRAGIEPLLPQLEQAFIYGSIAKGEENAASDVDLMLVGEDLSYSDVMQILEPIEVQLKRTVNPSLYSPAEFTERMEAGQNFLTKVMAQKRINLLNL